jgi:hypothetical protein
MPLANYTTEVSAVKSVGEIQGMLVAHKAKEILIEYDGVGEPQALSFIIATSKGNLPFILPSNIARVEAVLIAQRKSMPEKWHRNYELTMRRIHEQAVRVGWRILRDWIRAQMAILETEMVKLEQIFLPYMVTPGGKSLYEVFNEKGFYLTEGDKGK